MNWLLQNFGRRFRFALRNPRYVATSLRREITLADERFLSSITGVSPSRICSFLNEPIKTPAVAQCLHEADAFFHTSEMEAADLYAQMSLV